MISKDSQYFRQVELLVRVLPWIAKQECFALKGGTAINLFVHDMPRLSVDIDLTYVPVQERNVSLNGIEAALNRIAGDVRAHVPGTTVREIRIKEPGMVAKLHVIKDDILIKVEPNLVIRGTIFPCLDMDLCQKARGSFEASLRMKVVSLPDLYGGKICAALDRQHPRDLYDVKLLREREGITDDIRKGFLVYLLSHDRPIHEVLRPNTKDIRDIYVTDFQDMADVPVSCEELVTLQKTLPGEIRRLLHKEEKDFLLSFKSGDPQWGLLSMDGVSALPAVRWKLSNIQKMDKAKRQDFLEKLKVVLES